MDAISPPRGLIVDLVTPLTSDGALDVESLDRLIDLLVPHVHGVFAGGPAAGEGSCLDRKIRAELIARALQTIGGKVPLFAWVTDKDPEKTFSFIEAVDRAVTGTPSGTLFWVDTPLYYHSNRGLYAHYREMSGHLNRQLILHNDPEFISALKNPLKRNNIRTSILKELVRIETIAGLIFSGSMDRARNYQKACHGRPGFRIYDHNESNFLDFPSMSGAVSIGAVLAPRAWHTITEASIRRTGGNVDYPDFLHQIWDTGRHVRALMEGYRASPVPIVKAALHRVGIISSPRTATLHDRDISAETDRLLGEINSSGKK